MTRNISKFWQIKLTQAQNFNTFNSRQTVNFLGHDNNTELEKKE